MTPSGIEPATLRLLAQVQIRIYKKKLENKEYFNRLVSLINYERCARETKSSIAVTNSAFYKNSFHQETGLKFKEETSETLRLELSFVWCLLVDTSESRSEI